MISASVDLQARHKHCELLKHASQWNIREKYTKIANWHRFEQGKMRTTKTCIEVEYRLEIFMKIANWHRFEQGKM
jgi:hypothetical protein